jgi:hypothetical protein
MERIKRKVISNTKNYFKLIMKALPEKTQGSWGEYEMSPYISIWPPERGNSPKMAWMTELCKKTEKIRRRFFVKNFLQQICRKLTFPEPTGPIIATS